MNTLWRMPARPETDDIDPDTGEVTGTSPATDRELLNMDIKVVGTAPNGDEIVQVAPRGPDHLPDDATEIGTDYTDLPDGLREHVLEGYAVVEDADGNVTLSRKKVAELVAGVDLPTWETGVAYAVGDKVTYEGTAYECVQAHTSQADWTPPTVPALWTETAVEGQVPAWTQPTGAQDAYARGDKVTHDGQVWISLVDANTWEPGQNPEQHLWQAETPDDTQDGVTGGGMAPHYWAGDGR